MSVFVLDRTKKPLMPCTEKRARLLLNRGRARVHKMVPFTIRLVDRNAADCVVQPITVKLDPGAGTTGVAVVRVETTNTEPTHHVIHLSELEHRGKAIRKSLKQRAGYRRRRRSANLRYRPARFDNRTRKKGWLAPSLQHRVDTVFAWVTRYRRLAPISSIAMELVRFDTHGMSAPEVAEHGGVAYQQGELSGYEVREYLLEKWHRKCAYCDKENVPLQIEHVVANANSGSDRVSNLTLACEPCNRKKGAKSVEAFVGHLTRTKLVHGFQTGDLVRAVVTKGVHVGTWVGRVAVRASGSFNIKTASGLRQGIGWKWCTAIQRGDGYGYSTTRAPR